ncbi:hypothetical protein LCGC14_2140270 [marine sediment metagenome]|uniref:Uncharacterized protein n=1 Tax=marine sediment metagenome TaxID=412755 RepID=A0A0F9GUX5_9ZZZZ
MIVCPNCNRTIDIPDYIDTEEFEGHIRCRCGLLWCVVFHYGAVVSLKLEETLFPAMGSLN